MYRVSAKPAPAPAVKPPLEWLDYAHRLLDRFPLSLAFAAAMLQVAGGLLAAILFTSLF